MPLTGNVLGFVDDAFEGGEDEVVVDQEPEEPFQGGLPRVGNFSVFGSGGVGFVVAESHGDEPHLFGDAGALAGVQLPIPIPLR